MQKESVKLQNMRARTGKTGLSSMKLVWLIQITGWSADQRNLKMSAEWFLFPDSSRKDRSDSAGRVLKHNYEQEAVAILAPSVETCINCNKTLVAQNQICSVTVFSRNYVKSAMKFSSCCKDCKLKGNAKNGYKFYEEQHVYVEATDNVFLDRSLCLFQISLA